MARLTLRHTSSDSGTRTGAYLRGPSDRTITVADAGLGADAAGGLAVAISRTEFVVAVDSFSSQSAAIAATETIVTLETVLQTRFITGSTDTVLGADAAALLVNLFVTDSGIGAQSIGSLAAVITDTDAGAVADAFVALLAAMTAGDAIVPAESLALDAGGEFTVGDSMQISESVSLFVDLGTVSDSATGNETPVGNFNFSTDDAAVATDSASLTAAFTVIDAASSTMQAISGVIDNNLVVSDFAVGVDQRVSPSPTISFIVSDSATADDAVVQVRSKHKYPLLVVETNRDSPAQERRHLVAEGDERWE